MTKRRHVVNYTCESVESDRQIGLIFWVDFTPSTAEAEGIEWLRNESKEYDAEYAQSVHYPSPSSAQNENYGLLIGKDQYSFTILLMTLVDWQVDIVSTHLYSLMNYDTNIFTGYITTIMSVSLFVVVMSGDV